MKLHHIGFATREPEKYITYISKKFKDIDFTIEYGICEYYGATCAFITGEDISLEFITPLEKGNHLDRFLQKRGDALHHIAFYGKGKHKGALPGMYVDFNDITDENKLLIEEVEFKDDNTHICPTAVIKDNVTMGKNVFIGDFTLIREGAVIGDNVKIGSHCVVHPHAVIGHDTNIQNHCAVNEHSIIGSNCFIAPFFTAPGDNTIGSPKEEYVPNPAIVKDNVRIGANVCLKPGIVIEDGTIIGMGSVVTKDTEKNSLYYGSPAVRIK